VLTVFGAVGATAQTSNFECVDPESKTASFRIVGGHQADASDWPFIVSIRVETSKGEAHFCGGSVIDREKRWVLTAAHCFKWDDNIDVGKIAFVRPLRGGLTGGEPRMKVEKVIPHPTYRPVTEQRASVGDIALLKLAGPLPLADNMLPVIMSLAREQNWTVENTCAATAGWGLSDTANGMKVRPHSPKTLQSVEIKLFSTGNCQTRYGSSFGITQNDHVCAGYPTGIKDSCKGDSGGPLVVRGGPTGFYFVGIVSFGKGCGTKDFPGVYTRASTYRDWIFKTIGSN
jgi:secreted trypsin-like serine protease